MKYNTTFHRIDGVLYRKHGWFGCQLESYEWFKPETGNQRLLPLRNDWTIEIYRVYREGLKYRCLWRLPQDTGYEEYGNLIRKFYSELKEL